MVEPAPRPAGLRGASGVNHRGFTLIEILVTISIISLLLGIAGFALSSMAGSARERQMQSMLNGMQGALTEYQAKTGNVINHINPDNSISSSEQVVLEMRKVPAAEEMLLAALKSGSQNLNKVYFNDRDGDGINEIYDHWGTPILYRSNNLTWEVGNDTNPPIDGDLSADRFKTKFPGFYSAGPDRVFGTDDDISSIELE